ncbi:hypothetical protein, partial [Pseudomonas fluorescens]|uniref:hypothetical protein n=1 Tax=Pseudomonas fluorescens TaxID=294 RepID=UPI001BEB8AC4
LLLAPAAPPLPAQKLPTLIVAVSHKHNRLPIPYRKGETVSCLEMHTTLALGNQEKACLMQSTLMNGCLDQNRLWHGQIQQKTFLSYCLAYTSYVE